MGVRAVDSCLFRWAFELMLSLRIAVGFAVAALAWTSPRYEAATKADCPSAPLPVIISWSGCFRVMEDYATTEAGQWAIHIEAPDVILDLDGHSITGPGDISTASGIYAENSPGLRIRNGSIRGFLFGIRVENQAGSVEVSGAALSGSARAAVLHGDLVVATGNTFSEVHGYSDWPAAHSIGLEVFARECEITDNRIEEIYPVSSAEAVGISLSSPPDNCLVRGNEISNLHLPRRGRSMAIWVGGSPETDDQLAILDNAVSGFTYAYMASDLHHPAFSGNLFEVECLPSDVATYGVGATANTFQSVGRPCSDTETTLRGLAAGGDPEWLIRLAASLLEDQKRTAFDAAGTCARLAEAENILLPLRGMAQAQEQMKRVEASLRYCDTQSGMSPGPRTISQPLS